jgi:hypothetical protein
MSNSGGDSPLSAANTMATMRREAVSTHTDPLAQLSTQKQAPHQPSAQPAASSAEYDTLPPSPPSNMMPLTPVSSPDEIAEMMMHTFMAKCR